MHAISSYRGNRPTNKHTQTDRGDYNTLRRSFGREYCVYYIGNAKLTK